MHINVKTLFLLILFAGFFAGGVWTERNLLSAARPGPRR